METISRRAVLVLGSAAVASAALPPVPVAAAAKVVVQSWVVGTPGEYDWLHCWGDTAEQAKLDWLVGHCGDSVCENGDELGNEDCDCDVCVAYRGIETERVEAWDNKDTITNADWIRAGLGSLCSRCGYETSSDEGGCAVGDEAVCEGCMTLADWEKIDPERAVEMRAESEEEEG